MSTTFPVNDIVAESNITENNIISVDRISGKMIIIKDSGVSSNYLTTVCLKLDQTTPQTVSNGTPIFDSGINTIQIEGMTTPLSIAQGGTGSATGPDALTALLAQGAAVGTALPTGDSIVVGQIFRLTAQDSTAKAGQGLYMSPDGTNWVCIKCFTPYIWGNTGATPTFALIAGCDYIFIQDQEITSSSITMAYPGECSWTKTGEFAFAAPIMAGKTVKLRKAEGWDDAPKAIIEGCFRYDGTYLWISAVEGV